VNAGGKGAIVFSVIGEDYYPSAAYATLDAVTGAGAIVITDPRFGPDDGLTGYFPNGRVGRWGDYSAAVFDESGNIWMATEAINPPLISLPPGVCPGYALALSQPSRGAVAPLRELSFADSGYPQLRPNQERPMDASRQASARSLRLRHAGHRTDLESRPVRTASPIRPSR
jgi:hypothetical protein